MGISFMQIPTFCIKLRGGAGGEAKLFLQVDNSKKKIPHLLSGRFY